MAVREQVLDERAVGARHAGVVDREAEGQQVAQVVVLARLRLGLQDLPARRALLRGAPPTPPFQTMLAFKYIALRC